jgi:hypothetical protein
MESVNKRKLMRHDDLDGTSNESNEQSLQFYCTLKAAANSYKQPLFYIGLVIVRCWLKIQSNF